MTLPVYPDYNAATPHAPDAAVSPGAACHSDRVEISHILKAMQAPEPWAKGTLRFSTDRYTTAEEIDRALDAVISAVKRLRGE